jgi:hypothetical protein
MKKHVWFIFLASIALPGWCQHEQNFTFAHDGKIVFGTFTTPAEHGLFPTIIINPGSGPNDRDGTAPMVGGNVACLYPGLLNETLKPYKQLSDALVEAGFAVLRYDKLEFTYSAGALAPITFHKLFLPVESAIDFVKTRIEVDTNCIILLGHSEGSSLIPHIARNRNDIKALVSLAGPRTPLDSLLAYQLVYIAQTCDGDTNTAKLQASQILAYFDIVRKEAWDMNTPPLFGVPASEWFHYIQVVDSVAINYNLSHLPTLFVGMENDFNVLPAELIRLQHEVTITNDFWSIPGVNHFMTPGDDPHIAKILTDTLVQWLQELQCTTSGEGYDYPMPLLIYPNPFIHDVEISASPGSFSPVRIRVFDSHGIECYQLIHRDHAGQFQIQLTLTELPAGVYTVQMECGGKLGFEKIIKL